MTRVRSIGLTMIIGAPALYLVDHSVTYVVIGAASGLLAHLFVDRVDGG